MALAAMPVAPRADAACQQRVSAQNVLVASQPQPAIPVDHKFSLRLVQPPADDQTALLCASTCTGAHPRRLAKAQAALVAQVMSTPDLPHVIWLLQPPAHGRIACTACE